MDLVFTGTFLCCKHVGQQMLEQRSGSIILTGTVDALVGCAGLDTATKGGVLAMTRSFAAGIAREGVRVNAICPGIVATEPQLEWLNQPGARATMHALHLLPVARPEQVAPFAVYLASDEEVVVTGGIFPIDSGYMAFKADLDVVGAMRSASAFAPREERRGFRTTQVGEIPSGIAALLTRRIGVIDLTVEAALRGDRNLFVEAVLADGAITDPHQASQMVEELLLSQDQHLRHPEAAVP